MNTCLCNGCGLGFGYLEYLQTGNLLATSGHWKKFGVHSSPKPNKPTNGVFFDPSTGAYQSGIRVIGMSGFLEFEPSGGVNAYYDFPSNIGEIQISGITKYQTTLGKAALITIPIHTHWFPGTGCNSPSRSCHLCLIRLF
jgi:hypothetical protein